MAEAPQFGAPRPGLTYRDRPCAFGLAFREGRLALVCIDKGEGGAPCDYNLPGGALDAGEDEIAALVREFGEETGLRVSAAGPVSRANQYVIKATGEAVNNLGAFFLVSVEGEDAALKVEADHTLVWIEPLEALKVLRRDNHAWALTCWLRRSGCDGTASQA